MSKFRSVTKTLVLTLLFLPPLTPPPCLLSSPRRRPPSPLLTTPPATDPADDPPPIGSGRSSTEGAAADPLSAATGVPFGGEEAQGDTAPVLLAQPLRRWPGLLMSPVP